MIRILDEQVVNRIAAGEVVERPASVVKELVENALDAGAKHVEIVLRDGGRALVRVSDDGHGMDRHDALMCLERHATSKITSEADLVGVETMGFRGEALPSIASVSRFTLTTRRPDDELGTKIVVEGGKVLTVEESGSVPGTQLDVRALFWNVPARKKFLRSEATELGHAVEAVQRLALARPDVDFRLRHDDREVLRCPAGDRATRARDILGNDARGLIPVHFEDAGIAVDGLIGPPSVHRGEATGAIYVYVNGRFVRDTIVRRGLGAAFQAVLPRGRHPVALLDVRVPPDSVDVNVHPAKIEVRFRDPWEVERVVAEAVQRALSARPSTEDLDSAPILERAHEKLPFVLAHPVAPVAPVRSPPLPPVERPQGPWREVEPVHAARVPAHPDDDPRLPPPLRVAEPPAPARTVGVAHRRWLVVEHPDGLRIVDLLASSAAAALARWRQDPSELVPRALPSPVVVGISVPRERLDAWAAVGLVAEPFAGGVAVRAVPAPVHGADVPPLVRDLADGDVLVGLSRHVPATDDAIADGGWVVPTADLVRNTRDRN
jgi:DNA mismatch repair protein MutL